MLTKLYVKLHSDEGATATEYGILVAVIAFIVIAGALLFGNALSAYFGRLAAEVGLWNPSGAMP